MLGEWNYHFTNTQELCEEHTFCMVKTTLMTDNSIHREVDAKVELLHHPQRTEDI